MSSDLCCINVVVLIYFSNIFFLFQQKCILKVMVKRKRNPRRTESPEHLVSTLLFVHAIEAINQPVSNCNSKCAEQQTNVVNIVGTIFLKSFCQCKGCFRYLGDVQACIAGKANDEELEEGEAEGQEYDTRSEAGSSVSHRSLTPSISRSSSLCSGSSLLGKSYTF